MAIPNWTCPDGSHGGVSPSAERGLLSGSDIENASDVFELLSNTIRLEILASLYGRADAISYTELRESTSIQDKGRFNYHLRRLDPFVRSDGGAYTLTRRGENLVRNVVPEEQIRQYES